MVWLICGPAFWRPAKLIDVPVRLWSFYRDVEEFFTAVVGEGRCTLVV
jgi:hypothetical protein